MLEDFAKNRIPDSYSRINAVLIYIKALLKQYYKSLNDYDLLLLKQTNDLQEELLRLIMNELNISVSFKEFKKIELLNEDQKLIFDTVIEYIKMNQLAVIFINGPADIIAF
ncbi:36151_t:CDS:1 [Gigaspora margarita]|uniref:36151_t:CDS:1 n=1 Tax=Gigaspora margarita TaxID=4874 RepID=A0ABN7V176_GIGMA|nr:36151_t:CDS:1 [Gigaspora margarita]